MGMKVLVAEGDSVWRQILITSLQNRGYEPIVAADGNEAIAILSAEDAPQLALLDCLTLGPDGLSLCAEIRSRKFRRHTYLILLSSKSDQMDAADGVVSGADDCLIKPFRAAELVVRLRVGQRVVALHDEVLLAQQATQSLVENAPFGLASVDAEMRIRNLNPAFLTMLGHSSPATLVGVKITDLLRDSEQSSGIRQFLQTARRFDGFEAECKHREGKTVVLRFFGRPLSGGTDSAPRFELIAEDVTTRFQLEQHCQQAQRLEAIGRFAGSIAHDFNNFLSVIKGCTDLLLQTSVHSVDTWSKLNEISKASDEAAALVQQLLAFSRRQVLRPEPILLNVLVTEFEPMLRRLSGEEIDFQIELEPEPGLVLADPGQLRQILMNLVANARDAMPSGGGLTLKTRSIFLNQPVVRDTATVPAGAYVSMELTDTGCGIDPASQSRIFEPFFTTKGDRGNGLGLATTYGIVKQSQGFIWVASSPGQGTTFEIWLPKTKQKLSGKSKRRELPRLKLPATVLLVEDELSVRQIARQCLETAGITVIEAESPAAAIAAAKSHQGEIDLLLTDVVMPEMRGNELAERLREHCPDLKVLFMSGYAYNSAISEVPKSAHTSFLQKPFTVISLNSSVAELLNATA